MKNMKRTERMKLEVLLAAMLILGMVLVPVVSATADNGIKTLLKNSIKSVEKMEALYIQPTTVSANKSAEAKNIMEKIRQDLKKGKTASESDLEILIKYLEQMTGITLNPIQKEEAKEYIISEIKKDIIYQKMDQTFKGNTKKIIPKKLEGNGTVQYSIQSSYPVWIFIQPWVDINGGSGTDDGGNVGTINGANDLYLIEIVQGLGYVKYTLWYKDEDYPSPDLDYLYDQFRKLYYHRIEDKEEFIVNINTNQIEFNNIWSNDKTFADAGQHGDKTFPVQSEVYINVWNHAMDINDDNPSLIDHIIII